MITRIESRHNTTLRHLARLAREKKYRQGAGEMVCEGEKMLYEALSSGIAVKSILLRAGDTQNEELITRAEAQGARLFEAEPQVFALASDVETPQGVIFSCAMPKRFADDLRRRFRARSCSTACRTRAIWEPFCARRMLLPWMP